MEIALIMAIDERREMLAAIRELAAIPAGSDTATADLLAEELISTWPTRGMRKMLDKVKPGDIGEAVASARVLAAKAFETLEAKHGNGNKLRDVLESVVVAVVNVWLSGEHCRKSFLRVKRIINVRRRSQRKESR